MRDLGDRPLRGREREQQRFAAAYADPAKRALIVLGEPGIGKSAFLELMLERLAAQGALIGVGRHAEKAAGDDVAPLLNAIEQAVGAGLNKLYDPDSGMATLIAAVGVNGSAFAYVGSGLLRALATESSPAPGPLQGGEERLIQGVLAVLRWLEGFGEPVVLLVEDWGRASPRAQQRYARLLKEPSLRRLRLLATERPTEPASATLRSTADVMTMSPLPISDMRRVVADLLQTEDADIVRRVLDLLSPRSGNVFDLIQALQLLTGSGALQLVGADWTLDRKAALGVLRDSPSGAAIGRVAVLAPAEKRLARILALIGESLDPDDISAVSGLGSEAAQSALERLYKSGIAQPGEGKVRIAHDRIRAALQASMTEADRIRLSGELAEAFRDLGSSAERPEQGAMMLALRLGGGLDEIDCAAWAPRFANGARSARLVGDEYNASQFAEIALTLAERANAVTHKVLMEAALAAVMRSEHDLGQRRSDQLARQASAPQEQDEADEVRIFSARMAGEVDRAVVTGLSAARRAGIDLPRRPSLARIAYEVWNIRLADPDKALRDGPLADDELRRIAPRLRVLFATGALLHESNIRQALVLGARASDGRFGSGTALGASVRAYVCGFTGAYRSARRWAQIADARQSSAQPSRASAVLTTTYFGYWYSTPRAQLVARNDLAEALAYAEGDLATVAYVNLHRVLDSLFEDGRLEETAAIADRALILMKDDALRPMVAATRQLIANLSTSSRANWRLEGEHFSLSASEPANPTEPGQNRSGRRPGTMLQAFLAVLCGEYSVAAQLHGRLKRTFDDNVPNPLMAIWTFSTCLALYRDGRRPPRSQVRLVRRLARFNPTDHGHWPLLLDAERLRQSGQRSSALDHYEQAMAKATASGGRLEQGLVARVAAEGAAMLGARAAALGYRTHADRAWRSVGALGLAVGDIRGQSAAVMGEASVPEEMNDAAPEQRDGELRVALDVAERANRAKSRLLASVGHELRTPLQGIAGLVELAELGAAPIDLKALRGAVGQLTAVVGDLTDLGAVEAGGMPLILSEFDPMAEVEAVVAVHRNLLGQDGRRLIQIDEGERRLLTGDAGRIRQIVSNLVANAIKHGRGDVTLRVCALCTVENHVQLTIDVADQGAVLTPEDMVRIFEPFERGPAADRIAGLGLGLSVARRLARAMGGDLAVRSIADEGTVFSLHLTLPIFRQAASDQDEGRLQTPKVLLAEDTPLSRQVLSALLRAEGCVVVEAEDGDVAASNAMQTEFDLMILDMSMPGRSGLAVAEMIRRTDCCNRHTPIAIVTASNPKVFEADVAAVGIAHVLQKPIGRAEIRGILNTWAASAASRERQSEHLAQFSAEEIVLELHAALGSGEAAALLAQVESQIYSGMDALRQAIHSGDWVSGAASAHRLAGLAGQFGLSTLRCEALRLEALLETSTRAPTSEHVLSGLNGVEAVLRQTVWTSYGRTSGNPSLAKI